MLFIWPHGFSSVFITSKWWLDLTKRHLLVNAQLSFDWLLLTSSEWLWSFGDLEERRIAGQWVTQKFFVEFMHLIIKTLFCLDFSNLKWLFIFNSSLEHSFMLLKKRPATVTDCNLQSIASNTPRPPGSRGQTPKSSINLQISIVVQWLYQQCWSNTQCIKINLRRRFQKFKLQFLSNCPSEGSSASVHSCSSNNKFENNFVLDYLWRVILDLAFCST